MPRRRALLAGLGAASASLAGCNYLFGDGEAAQQRRVPGDWTPDPGEWAGRGYDQANSGHNPHASPPRTKPTVAWEVDGRHPSILVADGTVFLRDGVSLYGYDVEDGDELFDVSRLSGGLFGYVDGRLYETTTDGIDALTLEGESTWDDPPDYDPSPRGLVEREGYVFLWTGTDTIHHHDTGTGERVDATVHEGIVGGLANRDGALYAGLEDGVAAYDVTDGDLEELWRHDAGGFDRDPVGVAIGERRAFVARSGGGSTTGSALSIYDTEEETHVETVEFDDYAFPAAIGEYAYVIETPDSGRIPAEGEIHAYDGPERQWSIDLEPAPGWLVLADGTLYVGRGNQEQSLTALDAETGDELWTYEDAFPRAVVGETIYATTDDERFVALRS